MGIDALNRFFGNILATPEWYIVYNNLPSGCAARGGAQRSRWGAGVTLSTDFLFNIPS